MKILVLYLSTALVFFAADAVGLRMLIKPVFDRHIAHLYADPFRVVPAAVFYLGYVAGVLWFVALPALRDGDPVAALIGGALLGLMAYGTYEFTNYATLRDWSMTQVIVDSLWGAVLTGFSAWAGVMITRALV
ncbi:DUF2177 family protein [Sulfitobacter mediterraneus]|jgi:uncharacterized membrane protein|uniref:Putative membrane protein n=1 Tax=Sulfitobacter mediterraneus TaxID=83219 RepID=A0A2T6CJM2_9RHOB|nr:DUF2177 family protein [Sulfitobacter mediterraneus]KIN78686.1 Membrane protein-like protein [Sulfitobacter mediterraneus KCTC 32188]MBM1555514.1 DUF2177 family protein [Sulfitobacter mediterraneus]MBM1566933.1 DUF2177 family protein [Sulfitobacter mediterraneus]MBM1570735.1 DUF2177 family protein [Sulfitobacter mediterraneus]MBM1574535.1 DUF2177 family protein [Sulfitobacter mediterraneus]